MDAYQEFLVGVHSPPFVGLYKFSLAFVIADTPAHIDRPLDELLAVADAVMATFNVSRKVMR
jgi:hypothetical protein